MIELVGFLIWTEFLSVVGLLALVVAGAFAVYGLYRLVRAAYGRGSRWDG
jgi:Gpi18-like mannosyltransferase